MKMALVNCGENMNAQIKCAQNLGAIWFLLGYSKAIIQKMVAAHERRQTQRTLRELDVHLLQDIGVDPADVGKPAHEARKVLSRIYLKFPG
jgi:uncharacterized protein YjiS (DUF1127 family)